jgi:transcriptional regulator with XRE-family HTH domain
MRLRRDQMGMTVWRAACGVGVELRTFAEYEAGERLIPADQLAALAQLYNVPVFYFFEDLPPAEIATQAVQEDPQNLRYTVTTHAERIATLVEDFQKLDFARQQCLLAVARGLVDDNPATGK